jgi:hypothetical protein
VLDSAERVSVALAKQELQNRLRDGDALPRKHARRTLKLPWALGRVRRLARLASG